EPSWYTAEHLIALAQPRVLFARLRLRTDGAAVASYPLELLERRRTSRVHYAPLPVSAQDAAQLSIAAQRFGHTYSQTTDAERIERLLGLNIDAVFEDLNHPPYRDEIAGWVRYTRGASERHRDGLDARCMNVAPAELWLTFHAPWLLRFAPAVPWFRHRYRRQ